MMTETQFQKAVCDLCDTLHLDWFHNPDSRRMNPGLPDLIIIGDYGIIFAELKTGTGTLSKAQRRVIARLRKSYQNVHVWRPGCLQNGTILLELNRIRKPPTR